LVLKFKTSESFHKKTKNINGRRKLMAKLSNSMFKAVLVWEFAGIIDEVDPDLANRLMTSPPDPTRESDLYKKTIWWFLPFKKPAPALNKVELRINREEVENLNLRPGDMVWIQENRPLGMVGLKEEILPFPLKNRPDYSQMEHAYPDTWIRMRGTGQGGVIARTLNIEAPIAEGISGIIVAEPATGKSIITLTIGRSMNEHPGLRLMFLMVGERKEEVASLFMVDEQEPDLRPALSTETEVWFAPETLPAKDRWIISQAAFCCAMRRAENRENVGLLIDSATRLVLAAENVLVGSGLGPGGVKTIAVEKVAALINDCGNLRDSGSIACIATCLNSDNRKDAAIAQEFAGKTNWEVHLSRALARARIFPAITHTVMRNPQKLKDPETGKWFDAEGRACYFSLLSTLADLPNSFRGKEELVAIGFRRLSIALINSTPNNEHLLRLVKKATSEEILEKIEKAKQEKRREIRTTLDSVVAVFHLLLDILFSSKWEEERIQSLLVRTILERICNALKKKDPRALEKWLLSQLPKVEESRPVLEQKPIQSKPNQPKTPQKKPEIKLCTRCKEEPVVKKGLCAKCRAKSLTADNEGLAEVLARK